MGDSSRWHCSPRHRCACRNAAVHLSPIAIIFLASLAHSAQREMPDHPFRWHRIFAHNSLGFEGSGASLIRLSPLLVSRSSSTTAMPMTRTLIRRLRWWLTVASRRCSMQGTLILIVAASSVIYQAANSTSQMIKEHLHSRFLQATTERLQCSRLLRVNQASIEFCSARWSGKGGWN